MDHLKEEFAVTPITVKLVADPKKLTPSEFTVAYFHDFPDKTGWKVDETGAVKKDNGGMENDLTIDKYSEFLQTWLFFGLIFTTVRKHGESLLSFNDLYKSENNIKQLKTDTLSEKLKLWVENETSPGVDRNAVRMRMLRLSLVLSDAKKVIRSNCSLDSKGKPFYSPNPGDKYYLTDESALSLMVIGETLSAVQANIMDKLSMPRLQGWHDDNLTGWGEPQYAINKMRQDGWCPHKIFLVRRQLNTQAILLLNACSSHVDTRNSSGAHKACNEKGCEFKYVFTEDSTRTYITSHHDSACRMEINRDQCTRNEQIGPSMNLVCDILGEPDDQIFPLVKLTWKDGSRSEVKGLEVIKSSEVTKRPNAQGYVTISHVWSDGYGNEAANKLWRCQLEFIGRLLQEAKNDKSYPFWMDTLLIPVGKQVDEEKKDKKKKAIRQIHTIFASSECSIILDKTLVGADRDPEDCGTAMKLFSSGWMRRLWTLQEAFLSKELKIAFRENEKVDLKDFEGLQQDLLKYRQDTSIIRPLLRQQICDSIMWDDNRKRVSNQKSSLVGSNSNKQDRAALSRQIINCWRAARWRTTSNRSHEVVALATLLGIQSSDSSSNQIADASVQDNKNVPSGALEDQLEKLMQEFWIAVDSYCPGCIPAGIVFLSGGKLSLTGFGWAPNSFMTPVEVDYPDPLEILASKETFLDKGKGLVIECPGVLLHMDYENEFRKGLFHVENRHGFAFPVNGLIEWYHVTPIPPEPSENGKDNTGSQEDSSQLAIIMSRQSLSESPAEIGILVVIENEQHTANDGTLFSHILFRVEIRRVTSERQSIINYCSNKGIFGEVRDEKQRWCVDGAPPKRSQGMISNLRDRLKKRFM